MWGIDPTVTTEGQPRPLHTAIRLGELRVSGKKRKSKSKKPRQTDHSTIDEHRRHGKTLTPPLVSLPEMKPVSWMNDRLPEMLWAALLVSHLPRPEALAVFRQVAEYVGQFHDIDAPYDITHTGLSKLRPEILEEILGIIVATDECKEILRSLLLLRGLPARDNWEGAIRQAPLANDWEALMVAVAKTLYHQSQESTDCRWARLICALAAGRLKLPPELAKEYVYYPDYGNMRKVRPSIRATEMMLDMVGDTDREWPRRFWSQCLADTPCFPLQTTLTSAPVIVGTTPERSRQVYDLLIEHCNQTGTTTATDPEHDTVFGVAFYCLSILQELLRIGASQSITARLALRTIVECLITLAYLAEKNDPELWKSYRVFGAGQAKLQYLKLEELDEPPTYVSVEVLKELANEDIWEEFLPIELGHWEKANLRSLSIEANAKDDYDRFYAWTSAFAHGHWSSVRDAVYDSCGNPLHRLHRIPGKSARALPDVVPDACNLVDKVLEIVSKCYPDFPHRVTVGT